MTRSTPKIEIPIRFVNTEQEEFFNLRCRNQCFSGGYGNGKTFILCLKAITLLGTFPKYRVAFARRTFKDLRRTSMSTFYEILPREMYSEAYGGRRSDLDGYLKLINGSEVFWLNLDSYNEQALKSFEINTAIVDQAEELDENIYLHLDSRVGRWNHAEIPSHLSNQNFPINAFTKKPVPPSYHILGCNPDSRFHWIFRRYHPESLEYQTNYSHNHRMINCASTANPALNPELLAEMLNRDPEWVSRFVYGNWGISDASIHVVLPDSIINPSKDWLDSFLARSRKFRIFDHGDVSPTCCLWVAVCGNTHLVYREYYQPDKLISYHRQQIADLSGDETYEGNFCDPSMLHKDSQKNGGKWSVADEYLDKSIKAPSIYLQPADNNEYPIRNRINELLRLRPDYVNPITGKTLAPSLYFVRRSTEHPNGCLNVIIETEGQRRKLLGTENGRNVYSDERADTIADHAYDCLRYYCSLKAVHFKTERRVIPAGSFYAAQNELKKLRVAYNGSLPAFLSQ